MIDRIGGFFFGTKIPFTKIPFEKNHRFVCVCVRVCVCVCVCVYKSYYICNLRETSVAGVDQSPDALTPIEPRSPRSRTISRDCSSIAPLSRTLTCNIIHVYVCVCVCVCSHTYIDL